LIVVIVGPSWLQSIGPTALSYTRYLTLSRSGRYCSAWIGLTPKDHSTAGKTRLGGITRAGDESLRAALVAGATAVIQHERRRKGGPRDPWLRALLARTSPKCAAVALANKNARIAWKLMVSGQAYDPSRRGALAAPAA
jgi:transposase